MTWVFYGHYENQFVVAQSELTYISFSLANSALSSLRIFCSTCRFKNSTCSGWGSNFASFLIN